MNAVGLSEAEQVRLVEAVDWTNWTCPQTVVHRAGKGATSFLRQVAERLGLRATISRAGLDVIFVRLSWDEDS